VLETLEEEPGVLLSQMGRRLTIKEDNLVDGLDEATPIIAELHDSNTNITSFIRHIEI
jgi:hypothetical protein